MAPNRLETEEDLSAAIETYGMPLLRYCHHVLCDYQEAQDAVQTAFLRAWDYRAGFRPGSNLSAWLYRLAYTVCVDALRARKRWWRSPPPAETGRTDYIGPELRSVLGQLSARERALVFGRVMEERSYEELAEIYGVGAATLRKRYERARKKLARLLTEQEGQHEME